MRCLAVCTFRQHLSIPSSSPSLELLDTSRRTSNHRSTLGNISEERRSDLQRGGSLSISVKLKTLTALYIYIYKLPINRFIGNFSCYIYKILFLGMDYVYKACNPTILNLIKIQPDARVCRYLFTAKSLYMFRVSHYPSSGVLKTNRSLRYRS